MGKFIFNQRKGEMHTDKDYRWYCLFNLNLKRKISVLKHVIRYVGPLKVEDNAEPFALVYF